MLCNLVELFIVCLESEWLIGGTAKYVGYVLIKGEITIDTNAHISYIT